MAKPMAKVWYVVTCDKHGIKEKGGNFVKVSAPKKSEKMIGRNMMECPICKAERLKKEQQGNN